MNTLQQSLEFSDWLRGLQDRTAQVRIVARLAAAEAGNFGDCAPVGAGVSEMRVHLGPGYRIYFTRIGSVV
jgi:putative addiction module killer protein